MEKEYFNGLMARFMKVSGLKGKKMEVEFGKVVRVKAIQENGKMVQYKVSGYIYQKMEIDIKDNLKILKNMVWEHKDSRMVKLMQDIIKKTGQMAKDNTFG